MGYTTSFDGEITITPPIPWGEIKDSPFLPDNAKRSQGAGRDLKFRLDEVERETSEGVLHVRSAVALVSTWEDEARGYDIVEHLQEAVDAHRGHEFTGRIDCEGENAGDIWRLKVVARKAFRFEPEIVWPEASE